MECVMFMLTFRNKGFLRADGTPLTHGEDILQLLIALQCPSAVTITKCPAHQKTDTVIAKGDNLADEAARKAAKGDSMVPTLTIQDCATLITLDSLITAQSRVDEVERRLWINRGAIPTQSQGPAHGSHGH